MSSNLRRFQSRSFKNKSLTDRIDEPPEVENTTEVKRMLTMIKTTEVKRTPIMIKKKTNQTVDSKNVQDDSKYSKSQNRQCETENVTSKKNRSSAARV